MKKTCLAIAATFLAVSLFADNPKFKIDNGPWVTNVDETSFTVIFTSELEAMVRVEIAPDDGSAFEAYPRKYFYESVAGRRLCQKRHAVKVHGLEPGKAYRYRVIGKNISDGSNPYALVYGQENTVKGDWKVRTFNHEAGSCRFSMINDMHDKADKYSNLAKDIDTDRDDFIMLNGDIVSYSNSLDTIIRHTFGPIKGICSNLPVIFARGNHEGRGFEWHLTPWAFPSKTGEFYYTFRQGPVAFVVLDAGEDKPDDSCEYSGYAVYNEYRDAQLEWLKDAVKDPEFTSAPVKVCLMHIPAIHDPDSWYSQIWANDKIVPILNAAGVDLMLSGHHHKLLVREKGACGNDFPIIANSNVDRLDFKAEGNGNISLDIVSPEKKVIKHFEIKDGRIL